MLPAHVFAQTQNEENTSGECYTCKMPSLEFQTYVNFQVEMIVILDSARKEQTASLDNKKVGLFTAGILTLPKRLRESWKKIFQRTTKDAVEVARASRLGTVILFNLTKELLWKDSVWWLKILFRNPPFVRDWKTLQEIDISIHDLIRDLWMEWIWDDQISENIRKDINKLKIKYANIDNNQYSLFQTFETPADVKYKDMINMMLKLNSVMKSFVSNNSQFSDWLGFGDTISKFEKEISKSNIKIKFNTNLTKKMFDSYRCAKGLNACNDALDSFKDSLKVWPSITNSFNESMEIIGQANDKLKSSWWSFKSWVADKFKREKEELGLTPQQATLLRTVYGIDTTKLSKQEWLIISDIFFKDWSISKKLANSVRIKPMDFMSFQTIKALTQSNINSKQNRQDQKYLSSLAKEELESFQESLKQNQYNSVELRETLIDFTDIIMAQKTEDKLSMIFYDNTLSTRYFVEIWKTIQGIVEKQIWSKDAGLVKYLWDACEQQCSNKWTDNCYAK